MPVLKMQCQPPVNDAEPNAVRLPAPQLEKPLSPNARGLLKNIQRLAPRMAEVAEDGIPSCLPWSLLNNLSVLVAVSQITEAAQNAMRVYSVPASFLIAEHILYWGWNPSIKNGERFASERLLLEEARDLATDPSLSAALELAESPIAYARRLCELGQQEKHFSLSDVASYIADYDLAACDDRYRARPVPSRVSIDEAARLLFITPETVRSLMMTERMIQSVTGFVDYRCLRLFEQRRLCRQIWDAKKLIVFPAQMVLPVEPS